MGKLGNVYIPVDEQETVIQFSRAEDFATVCTSDKTVQTKLNRLVENNPDNWELISDDGFFSTYRCHPKKLISYRSKSSPKVKRQGLTN